MIKECSYSHTLHQIYNNLFSYQSVISCSQIAQKCMNVLKVSLLAVWNLFGFSDYEISQIKIEKASPELIEKLKTFEASFIYPFGEEEDFKIMHGKKGDYFAFFNQLGKTHYYVATCKKDRTIKKIINGQETVLERKAGEIAAVGCGVLRTLPTKNGKSIKAWYICDLKVGKDYRGEHLPLLLVKKAIWKFFQCPRGFGICMNPQNGKPKAAEIWRQHAPIKGSTYQTLTFYTLTKEQLLTYREKIVQNLRIHGYMKEGENINFVSTTGMKDYEISNKEGSRSWQLLHCRPSLGNVNPLKENYEYMLTAVEGSPLDIEYENILGKASSTAQIVSYGMKNFDFNIITSNEI